MRIEKCSHYQHLDDLQNPVYYYEVNYLNVINEHNNTACNVIDIHPECTCNGISAVHEFGDNYNGISCFLVLVLTRIIHTRAINLNSLISSRVCPEE